MKSILAYSLTILATACGSDKPEMALPDVNAPVDTPPIATGYTCVYSHAQNQQMCPPFGGPEQCFVITRHVYSCSIGELTCQAVTTSSGSPYSTTCPSFTWDSIEGI
jgi:hypothetical protein